MERASIGRHEIDPIGTRPIEEVPGIAEMHPRATAESIEEEALNWSSGQGMV